jgi:hypothetical protein
LEAQNAFELPHEITKHRFIYFTLLAF